MWFNPIMTWILRSPLHPLLSKSILLVTYTGHKSGKTYTIPVNYNRQDGILMTVSLRSRTWWRNLRGGTPVRLLLQGREVQATGQALEGEEQVTSALAALLKNSPQSARFLKVSLDVDKQPNMQDVHWAAADRVIVQFKLPELELLHLSR